MSEIKQDAVLERISDTLNNAIVDSRLERQSQNISILKDGNDFIQIESRSTSDSSTEIYITDKKEILFSEDLLDTLQDLHPMIVVNGLSIETEYVFQAVKDSFDTLSTSYEFVKTTEKRIEELTAQFKFGDNKFLLTIKNDTDEIKVSAEFGTEISPAIVKTIEADTKKVEQALNKMFKN